MLIALQIFLGLLSIGCGFYEVDRNLSLGCTVLLLGGFTVVAGIEKLCLLKRNSDSQKAYIDEDRQARILCTTCGEEKAVDADPCSCGEESPLAVNCRCGFQFLVVLERNKRRDSRYKVELWGEYAMPTSHNASSEMVVEDMSSGGLRFMTEDEADLWTGDLLSIRIAPEKPGGPVISRNAIVRHIEGRSVGAQFCDDNTREMPDSGSPASWREPTRGEELEEPKGMRARESLWTSG